MDKLFIIDFSGMGDNKARGRSYGLRRGDIVKDSNGVIGEVVNRGFMDNNRVLVLWNGAAEPTEEVAEWMQLVEKCEGRTEFYERPIETIYSNLFTGLCIRTVENLKVEETALIGLYRDIKIKRTR